MFVLNEKLSVNKKQKLHCLFCFVFFVCARRIGAVENFGKMNVSMTCLFPFSSTPLTHRAKGHYQPRLYCLLVYSYIFLNVASFYMHSKYQLLHVKSIPSII